MGIFDRLFGRQQQSNNPYAQGYGHQSSQQPGYGQAAAQQSYPQGAQTQRTTPGANMTDDERAIARYEYMLKTAPPEEIEKAHQEAFAKLTPDQRQQVLTKLATANPQDAPTSTDPQVLARAATRAEMRQPGILRSSFGDYGMGSGMGMGMGGMSRGGGMGFGGTLLTGVAGAFVGTAIADAMFDDWGSNYGQDRAVEEAYRDGYQDGEHDERDDDRNDQNDYNDQQQFDDQQYDNGDVQEAGFTSSDDQGWGNDDGGFDSGFDGGDFGGGDFGDSGGFDF